jgi:hypothetical protein
MHTPPSNPPFLQSRQRDCREPYKYVPEAVRVVSAVSLTPLPGWRLSSTPLVVVLQPGSSNSAVPPTQGRTHCTEIAPALVMTISEPPPFSNYLFLLFVTPPQTPIQPPALDCYPAPNDIVVLSQFNHCTSPTSHLFVPCPRSPI